MGGEIRIWERAARALANIGEAAVPGLIECLETPIPAVRTEAARALREIGPAAKAAVPALEKALNDENAEVRSAAAQALKDITRPHVNSGDTHNRARQGPGHRGPEFFP
jgi:HEAT repeat protein